MKNLYKCTVITERDTLIHILGSEIIPRCYKHLQTLSNNSSSDKIKQYYNKFENLLENVLDEQESLSHWR